MAGHSKFANIKHRKAAQDAKRGKVFTKLIREITVAAKGGADLDKNPKLRDTVDKAFRANMKKDVVERAIQRGAGGLDGADMEEVRYEGYGPNGVAVLVDCLTDNRNRTVSAVRHAFSRSGGNLGTDGSVAYLFTRMGLLSFDVNVDEEALMEAALELGAEDVSSDDDAVTVSTTPEQFSVLCAGLTKAGFAPSHAEIMEQAATQVTLDAVGAEKMLRLIDVLEDLDDVQTVSSNADIPADILAQL